MKKLALVFAACATLAACGKSIVVPDCVSGYVDALTGDTIRVDTLTAPDSACIADLGDRYAP